MRRSTAPIPIIRSDWRSRVARLAERAPLIETHPSTRGLRTAVTEPRTIFLGIGLCSPDALSRAVPIDVLGVLLPAELVRRASGAEELLVVVADQHAVESGHDESRVHLQARTVQETIERVRDVCRLSALRIVRSSSYSGSVEYQSILDHVRQVSSSRVDYVHRQLADVLYFQGHRSSLLKVGWVLRQPALGRRCDEVAFDQALLAAGGRDIGFVYCRPGRALSDRTPRVAPYLVRRPEERLLLCRREDPHDKLTRAAEDMRPGNLEAYRRHLRMILYTYGRLVEHVRGPTLAHRADSLLRRLT